MGFRVEHLTPDELLALRREASLAGDITSHLYQCFSCRREIADSLLLGRLIGAKSASPIKHRSSERHLSIEKLTSYHAAAYESEDVDPQTFLLIDHHLRRCDRCFLAYVKLHQRLSPSPSLTDKVVRRAVAVSAPPVLGTLTIAAQIIRRLRAEFSPAQTEEPSGNYEPRFMQSVVLGAATRSMVDWDSPPLATTEFALGDTAVEVQFHGHHPKLRMQISVVSAGTTRPREGLVIQLVDENLVVLKETRTDATGHAILELLPNAVRLRFRSQDNAQAMDVRLDLLGSA